ncbi:MAG TPA: hypothetical protein VK678_13090, partial [Bradyrhizobium sp.]|nr:hypothetical protein [Bradyrhizobium sp.]
MTIYSPPVPGSHCRSILKAIVRSHSAKDSGVVNSFGVSRYEMVHNPGLYFYDTLSGALPAATARAVRLKFLFASAADVGESCARFGLGN